MSAKLGYEVGDFVIYDARLWRVGLVSELRMRLDPLTGNIHTVGDHNFTHYGASVNVSPGSVLDVVPAKSLTGDQLRRAERLVGRDPNSFKTVEDLIMAATAQPTPAVPAKPKAVAQPAVAAPKSSAVAQPTLGKNAVANKERLAANAEKKAEAKAAKPPVVKKEKELRACACGCTHEGQPVMVAGYFAQGHDARFKSWMIKIERGEMKVTDLPEVVQQAYKFVKKGDGFVTTKNYKGEAHTGYDKKPVPAAASAAE